ncbi:hypothetical protein LJB90_00840 [Eubacteriales bacterium OttesenSCG-928-G02]|nr:hypothetical protein [Eubacteriales bacterium OttesenSCG-928-G02]
MITSITKYLPKNIVFLINLLPKDLLINASEIRLRLNSPVSLTLGLKNYLIDKTGRVCKPENAYCCTESDINECLSLITRSSLYTFDETIKNGYIPLENGARAGICGSAVTDKNGIKAFNKITSISLRIQRLIPDLAENLIGLFKAEPLEGVLVISPPALGKTTYLRSAAYLLSRGKNPLRVGLADEKCELFASGMENGLIDVISGCKKNIGIDILTKTMSPQIIICDEVSEYESDAIINAQNSGVCLISSAHGKNVDGVLKRPFINKMYEAEIFKIVVRLFYENGYKSEIIKL